MTVATVSVLLDIHQAKRCGVGLEALRDSHGSAHKRLRVEAPGHVPVCVDAGTYDREACAHHDGRPCHSSVLRADHVAQDPLQTGQLRTSSIALSPAYAAKSTSLGPGDMSMVLRAPLAPRDASSGGRSSTGALPRRAAGSDAADGVNNGPTIATRTAPGSAALAQPAQACADSAGSGITALFRGAQKPTLRVPPITLGPFLPPVALACKLKRGNPARPPLPDSHPVAAGQLDTAMPRTRCNRVASLMEKPPAGAPSNTAVFPKATASSDCDTAARGSAGIGDRPEPVHAAAGMLATSQSNSDGAGTLTEAGQHEYVLDEQEAVCSEALFEVVDLSKGCSVAGLCSAEAMIPWWFSAGSAAQ